MKWINCIIVIVLILVSSGFNSCKNSQTISVTKNSNVTILSATKTPVTGGAGTQGMKISLSILKNKTVTLDSMEYNLRRTEIDILKQVGDTIWVTGYFYSENTIVVGKESIQYIAKGDSCTLFYTLNGVGDKVLIPKLTLGQDNTLWE